MTGDARFCPQCGTRRAGFFRFCPTCGFDYDELLPAEVRQAADPKAPAPTISTLARPVPLSARPPKQAPEVPAATASPAAPVAAGSAAAAASITPGPTAPAPAVWPPPGAVSADELEVQSSGPEAMAARAALIGTVTPRTRTIIPDDEFDGHGPGAVSVPPRAEVVRPTRSARVLTRRPDLTLTRVAIVVLAALLGFSALSNLARSSSNSSSTTSPQTSIGSPLTEATPGASGSGAPSATVQPAVGPTGPTGPTQTATVASITDGDTIRVKIDGQEYPVRYIGMDTPEPDATDPAMKQMAISATAANASFVEGQEVQLEREVSDTDRFGRLLRDIWLVDDSGNYVLVNIELVRLGLAKIATFPPDVRYVRELQAAQDSAQAGGLGMWGLGQPASGAPEPGASTEAAPASSAAAAATPQTLVGGVAASQCHPSYDPCLPIVDDLDCGEVRAMVDLPVQVKGPDVYNLDADGDGTACEIGY
jgi:micrococcal nuclease